MKQHTGTCLCGKVKIRADLKSSVGACHCHMCRTWSSGPLMGISAIGEPEMTGQGHINTYTSSDWAERAFCRNCGSNLYYHLKPGPYAPEGEYILSAGLFNDEIVKSFDHEVFVDQAPDWYAFAGAENRKCMTEADIMAMVESGSN